MKKISVLEFVSELNTIEKDNSIGPCLFLGAGADVSSGGVLFSDLKKSIVSNERENSVYDQESFSLIDKDFNEIMDALDDERRCSIIEYFIKNSQEWMPSDGYKLLVLLAKEKCISSVITTNFANLLEKTQEQLGIDAFQIFSPATAIPAQYFINRKMNKAVYLKMHGDLNGKLITHLTNTEIEGKPYQTEFIKLFEHLICNEVLVFLGYSGWDTKIAEIFETNISSIKTVYWCNIVEPDEKAPLIKLFKENNILIKFINYNFDETLQTMATELFKDRLFFHVDSIFIWAMVKFKIERVQKEFIKNIQQETEGLVAVNRTKQDLLDDFVLDRNRNLCIMTGNSGVGKSLLLAKFCESYQSDGQVFPVPLNSMVTYSNNLLDYIVKKLGYVAKDPFTVLYQFSSWASEQQKDFIFIIDNLGNKVGTVKELAVLLNNLIELAYVVRTFRRVKFIITLRTNIWNNIYQFLDENYLHSIIWNDENNNINASVRLGSFDEYEIKQAKKIIFSLTKQREFSSEIMQLIKEPSLYGLIQKNAYILEDISNLNIYKVFEQTFFNGPSKRVLEKLAYSYFYRYIKSAPQKALSIEAVEYMKNSEQLKNILSIEEEEISFKNDLVFEYSLASYLNSKKYIDIFLNDYENFEQEYLLNQLPLTMYNGIVRYCGIICENFGKVIRLLYFLITHKSSPSQIVKKFVNDVFKFMALYNAEQYSKNICRFETNCDEYQKLHLFIIHSTGFLKDCYAYSVLDFLKKNSSSASTECVILLNDRFSHGLRNLKTKEEIKAYFLNYVSIVVDRDNKVISLFLLLLIMGRIGKDNIFKENYEYISQLVVKEIKSISAQPSKNDIQEAKDLFLKHAYLIFFNASDDLEEKYYHYSQKSEMIAIFGQIKKHRDLTEEQISTICLLTNHFATLDFFVCNVIFIHMATYSLEYALKNLDAIYNNFDNNTTVLELDFYLSAVFLACYVDDPLNRQPYLIRFKKVINDFETKLFISPSSERLSSVRKFAEKFELEFEDGFNLLTNYTYTAPMYKYIKDEAGEKVDEYLSLLWELVNTLEINGMYNDMVRIIQTINQMTVNWPIEGLEALNKFSNYKHSILRKAIIRTIGENYLRYPIITEKFLEQTGEAFSEDELLEVYSTTNSQIENRTLEQLVWARIIHYIKEYLNPQILDDIIKIFEEADTLTDFFCILVKYLLF